MSTIARRASAAAPVPTGSKPYRSLVGGIETLLEHARRTSARAVNAVMTATYWEIGRRIVEYEQQGKARAEYGEALLKRLAVDLTSRYGRGFGVDNLQRFRLFYLAYSPEVIPATSSRRSLSGRDAEKYATASRISGTAPAGLTGPEGSGRGRGTGDEMLQTPSAESALARIAARFPLPWSAYVRLLSVRNENARLFYETEALRTGWSVRQLNRQIQSQFYERTCGWRIVIFCLKIGDSAGLLPSRA